MVSVPRREAMSQQSLEALLKAAGNPADMLRNSQIGAYVYPVVPAEYTTGATNNAPGATRCVLFDQSHHMVEHVYRRSRRPEAAFASGDQQLCEISGQQRQTVRALHLRRPCDRRRNSVSSGAEQAGFRGTRAGGQLDPIPCRRPAATTSRPRKTTGRPRTPAASP